MTSKSSVGALRIPDSLSTTRPMDDGSTRPYVPSDGVTATSGSSDAYTADPLYSSVPSMRLQSHVSGSSIVGAADTDFPSLNTRFDMPVREARSSSGVLADSDPNYTLNQLQERARLRRGEADRERLQQLHIELGKAETDDEVINIVREMSELGESIPTELRQALAQYPQGGGRSKRRRRRRSRRKVKSKRNRRKSSRTYKN